LKEKLVGAIAQLVKNCMTGICLTQTHELSTQW